MNAVEPSGTIALQSALVLPESLESAHFPEDHRVLAGWPPRQAGPDPLFGELCWDLTAGIATPNLHSSDRVVDFNRVAGAVRRITAMEFIAARLSKREASVALMYPSGALQQLTRLNRFNQFLDAEHDGCSYADVDQALLDDYLRWLRQGTAGQRLPGAKSLASYVRVLKVLWLYRDWLTHDALTFEPWGRRSAFSVAGGVDPDENSTERIPEPVIAALLQWAQFYVYTAADDILTARKERESLQSRQLTGKRGESMTLLQEFIARRRADGRGLPERRNDSGKGGPSSEQRDTRLGGRLNIKLLAKLAGFHDWVIYRNPHFLDTVEEAVREIGFEPGGFDTLPAVCATTGVPWRGPFDAQRVEVESNNLLAACYILIAYLTGARDSELQGLERGCHFAEPTHDGVVMRHKIRGWVVKKKGGRRVPAVWVTLAEAARAVEVLESLTDNPTLITRVNRGATMAPASDITDIVNAFAAHVNTIADRTGLPPIPPVVFESVDGETTTQGWWFTTRQFRKTLAWHIARQPFGLVAGTQQYQQASTAIFEGYAGTSESGFRAEVEKERAEAQLDDIIERYEDDVHGRPFTGGAAARLKADFANVRAELGDFPGRRADRARVREMLRGLSRTYRVGVLADCAFDEANPDKAVCVSESAKARKAKLVLPILDACQPANCANACQTKKHIEPWQRMVAEVNEHLKDKKLNDVQRQVLVRQRKAWLGILDRLHNDEGQESA